MDFIWLKLFFQTFVSPKLILTGIRRLVGYFLAKVSDEERTRPNITETNIYFDPEDFFIDYYM